MGADTPTISRDLARKTNKRHARSAQRHRPNKADQRAVNSNSDPFRPDASPVEARMRRVA